MWMRHECWIVTHMVGPGWISILNISYMLHCLLSLRVSMPVFVHNIDNWFSMFVFAERCFQNFLHKLCMLSLHLTNCGYLMRRNGMHVLSTYGIRIWSPIMITGRLATWRFELALFALLAKVTVSDVEVSGNENLDLMASSSTVDCSMGKGKGLMNETSEKQLMESELQKLKLHDNMASKAANNIIDVPNVVIPDSTPQSIPQVRRSCWLIFNMLWTPLLSLKKNTLPEIW